MLHQKLNHLKHYWPNILPALVVLILLLAGFIYSYMRAGRIEQEFAGLRNQLASATALLSERDEELARSILELGARAEGINSILTSTQQNIDAVRNQVGGVEQNVGAISGKVGTLEKLAETDPEILKKYSKVYFMNENYVPAYLFSIPELYLYNEKRAEQINVDVWPYLKNMLDTAKANGHTLYIKSGYRSFSEQQSIKSAFTVTYGAGTANSFSAEQGYSEHQLGTTIDLIAPGLGGVLDESFDRTNEYKWLQSNAHRFGFVLSYPKGNAYYVYEPWHWRFVGIKLATDLHSTGRNFYDLDQRDIDKYLINVFD